ncbi:MAG TPA: hypothetical protein VN380_00620 [Thermoanaerobaculia bacterium]|jgi:hypothetical protein|nr:hypothetical protein [Thermoanaerobaculia bacterium]
MRLLDLWQSDPSIENKRLEQIIAFAGEGRFAENNDTSREFRQYLSRVGPERLKSYCAECLSGDKFAAAAFALQDVINEIGRRLGFSVQPGRYRGVTGEIGYDGLWTLQRGHVLVVEVKTSDAYRVSLNTVAGYRKRLIENESIPRDDSSCLIIVGRQDTGGLEAEVRGSRHAWEMRLLSIDALLKLLDLRQRLEDPGVVRRVGEILVPHEFTRVDDIVDIVFETAEDTLVEQPTNASAAAEILDVEEEDDESPGPRMDIMAVGRDSAARVAKKVNAPLIQRSRGTFSSADESLRVVCAYSRTYGAAPEGGFWFAFHPYQKDYLDKAKQGFVALTCGDAATILLIPILDFSDWLTGMHETISPDRRYWHVRIRRVSGRFTMYRRKGQERIELTKYLV